MVMDEEMVSYEVRFSNGYVFELLVRVWLEDVDV